MTVAESPRVQGGDEIGTALGRLEADRPKLAEKLLDVSVFARVTVFFLRAFDMYCEEHALSATERRLATFDTHVSGDSLVVSFSHPSRGGAAGNWQGGSVPFDAAGWVWARTVRLSRLLELANVMEACEELTRKLEEYCLKFGVPHHQLALRNSYPKFIRGLSYLVFEFER